MTSKGFNAEKIDIVGDTNQQVFDAFKSSSDDAGTNLFAKCYVASGESTPVIGGVDRAMHAKLVIIDDELVILGSGNQDRFAWYNSCELNLAYEESQATCDAVSFFDELWQRGADAFYRCLGTSTCKYSRTCQQTQPAWLI